jgi:exodeoxyribonuclease VII large subunit
MRAKIPPMFPRPAPAPSPPRPYTVSELLSEVGTALRTGWRDVSVVGEIGRFDLRGGHGYFTLKDRSSALSAIMFASDLRRVPFRMEPGLEVVVRGSLDLYAPQGKFQIKVFTVEPVGRGALQLAFEQLKAKLESEGLFDVSRKRPIPRVPRRIAVGSTS